MTGIIAGLVFLLVYYTAVWFRFGRTKKSSVVVPLYYPPRDMSPAQMRFLCEKQYDEKVFICALISLAAKKVIAFSKDIRGVVLKRLSTDTSRLSPDESVAFSYLMYGNELVLSKENSQTISNAMQQFKIFMMKQYGKKFFSDASQLFTFFGLLFSYIIIITDLSLLGLLRIYHGPNHALSERILATLALSIPFLIYLILGAYVLIYFSHMFDPQKRRSDRSTSLAMVRMFFYLLFATIIVTLYIVDRHTFWSRDLFVFSFAYWVIVGINEAFFFIVRGRTSSADAAIREIEGFRMFIAASEDDRMNFLNPPQRTRPYAESLMPYAFALGIEQKWMDNFAGVLGKVVTEGLECLMENYEAIHTVYSDKDFWDSF